MLSTRLFPGYHVQVQVEHVVHVAQQVQPPGAITTALAEVQVVPTFPVKRNIVYTSFRPGSACVDHHSSVVPRAELLSARPRITPGMARSETGQSGNLFLDRFLRFADAEEWVWL